MVAGLCGAVGAVGLILAKKDGGSILYIMPLVFGGAPVVNSILDDLPGPGLQTSRPDFHCRIDPRDRGIGDCAGNGAARLRAGATLGFSQLAVVCFFIALTAVSFGCYGPTLHKGQVAMAGSRLRPFLCVGIAYFLVAVLVPSSCWEPRAKTANGVLWERHGASVAERSARSGRWA